MFPKRIIGFMGLARQVILQTPGLTAQEVYTKATEIAKLRNRRLSASGNPQNSLVATLHKHYSHYGLERREGIGREFRFYPEGSEMPPARTGVTSSPNGCCLALPPELDKRLEALVNLGRFPDKHKAQQELIAMGLQTLMAKLAS